MKLQVEKARLRSKNSALGNDLEMSQQANIYVIYILYCCIRCKATEWLIQRHCVPIRTYLLFNQRFSISNSSAGGDFFSFLLFFWKQRNKKEQKKHPNYFYSLFEKVEWKKTKRLI